jgi:Rieske Fe-S protein
MLGDKDPPRPPEIIDTVAICPHCGSEPLKLYKQELRWKLFQRGKMFVCVQCLKPVPVSQ